MKPLLRIVALCFLAIALAEETKELAKAEELIAEADEIEPQNRPERCTTCGSLKLNLNSPNQVLAQLQAIPGTEIHTQQSFEGCSSDKGCAGLKVKDGTVIERFGDLGAFRAAAAADSGNEFTFHAAGQLGSNVFEGGIPNGGPYWWMNENSPFKNGGGSFEKFSKSSSSFTSSGSGLGGSGVGGGSNAAGFSAGIDLSANPFLNGDFSKLAGGFSGGSDGNPAGAFKSSSFESSSFSSSNKGEVDISKNPFLNGASGAGFQAQAGFGQGFGAGSGQGFASSGNANQGFGAGASQFSETNQFSSSSSNQGFSGSAQGASGNQGFSGSAQGASGNQGFSGSAQGASANQGFSGSAQGASANQGFSGAQGGFGGNANQFGNSGAGFSGNSFSSGSKFSTGYTGSSPSPFTATARPNLIQNTQKASEFDFEQTQTQQNIDEAFQSTGNVHAHEHSGGDLQQTCAGQGYVCVHKAQCNNGVVNGNGVAVLQGKTKKQYCNTKTEICCRIETAGLSGVGSSFASQGSGLFVSNQGAQGTQGTQATQGSFGASQGNFGSTAAFGSGTTAAVGSASRGQGNQFGFGSTARESSSGFGTTKFGAGFGSTVTPTRFGGANEVSNVYKSTSQSNFIETDSFSAGSENAGVFRPGASGSGLKPGIPYLPPVDSTSSSSFISSTAFPTTLTTPRPFTTPRPTYLPPSTSAPGYLPPEVPEQTINTETRLPRPNYIDGSLILDETRQPPRQPTPVPVPNDVPAGCAAALKCTPIEFCTAEGVISNTTVVLTREQDAYRVPLTDCKDLESGRVGKCCRDPFYTDPWPTNQLGKWVPNVFGGNDGKYVPDSRGSQSINRPQVTVRPPTPVGSGTTLLNNFMTPKPTVPAFGPNQVTPGFATSSSFSKGQFETRGQGQGVRQGQGSFVQQGQGQFGVGATGQTQGGAFGQGSQTQFTSTTQSFGSGGTLLAANRGQGQFQSQGQGQTSQGAQGTFSQGAQGTFSQGGQGSFAQGGAGQIAQGGAGQFAQGGAGQFAQGGAGQFAQGGAGQYAQGGQGQFASQGQSSQSSQGQFVSQSSQGQGGQGSFAQGGRGQIGVGGAGQFGVGGVGFGLQGQSGQSQFTSTTQQKGFGQSVSQGQGQLVSQGFGQGVRQGGGQAVLTGQGQLIGQGQGGSFGQQSVSGVSGGFRAQGGLLQGQGQGQISQGFGQSLKQGAAFSQEGGFSSESEGEVYRLFLSQYSSSGECGVLNGQKPYGNRNENEVDFAEIPWQAMVLLQTNRSLLCGGVITRPDVVLTSASCIDGLDAKNVLIKGGEWKLGIDDEPLPFQIVQVKNILRHPFYKRGSLLNDAAVLVLSENLRFAKNIYPICLPKSGETLDAFYNGAGECILTGWGKQVLQAHLSGAIMHSLNVSLLNPGECQAKLSSDYPHLLENYAQDSCACGQPTNPANNICRVDIGSALACTTDNSHYVLRGLYSWDSGCQAGNQLAAFYKFDLEWYEWAIGLIESTRFAQYTSGSQFVSTNKFSEQIKKGVSGVSGVKGGLAGVKGGKGQFSSGSFATGFSQFANEGSFGTELSGPITNSFSASFTEKKVFQTEPKIITYTTKPEIVTFTTKPEYFTFTTKPKIVTYTTKPQIVTYETSGSGTNPRYVAPDSVNPTFSDVVGHKHNAQCKCLENGK